MWRRSSVSSHCDTRVKHAPADTADRVDREAITWCRGDTRSERCQPANTKGPHDCGPGKERRGGQRPSPTISFYVECTEAGRSLGPPARRPTGRWRRSNLQVVEHGYPARCCASLSTPFAPFVKQLHLWGSARCSALPFRCGLALPGEDVRAQWSLVTGWGGRYGSCQLHGMNRPPSSRGRVARAVIWLRKAAWNSRSWTYFAWSPSRCR